MKHLSHIAIACLAIVCFLCCSSSLDAQVPNWPQFRGTTGDGQAVDAVLPLKIDDSNIKWKTPIHGKGWSSPVVWGDQIWLTTATEDGTKMSVLCIDRSSGTVLIDKVLIENKEPAFCHAMNSYATPTPVIEDGRIYVHFGSYLTACLNTKDASLIWQRKDLECDHYRGPASSPIIEAGKLFVAYDGFDVQYVVALDKNTGKTIWKRDRDIDYGTDNGDRMKAYCTAHVIEVKGRKELIYPSAGATIAYDLESGAPLWTAYHGGMNASARPIFHNGLLFITNGMGQMAAVRPGGSGDVTDTHVEWQEKKAIAKKTSQLIVKDHLYMISDDGIATCREPKTGKLIWKVRVDGDYAASPIFASEHIYLFSREGKISVIQPSETYTLVSESNLGDGFMASPAVVGNKMYLRSKTHLYCVGG